MSWSFGTPQGPGRPGGVRPGGRSDRVSCQSRSIKQLLARSRGCSWQRRVTTWSTTCERPRRFCSWLPRRKGIIGSEEPVTHRPGCPSCQRSQIDCAALICAGKSGSLARGSETSRNRTGHTEHVPRCGDRGWNGQVVPERTRASRLWVERPCRGSRLMVRRGDGR